MAKLSEFEQAFADARKRKQSTFSYKGKLYGTERADRPGEKLGDIKDYGDEAKRMAGRPYSAQVSSRTAFDPREVEEGLGEVDSGTFLEDIGEKVKEYSPVVGGAIGTVAAVLGAKKALAKHSVKKAKELAEKADLDDWIKNQNRINKFKDQQMLNAARESRMTQAERQAREAERQALPQLKPGESPAVIRKNYRDSENIPRSRSATPEETEKIFRRREEAKDLEDALSTMTGEGGRYKRGGMVKKAPKSSYKSGGSVGTASRRADGIAKKGLTRGKIY